MPAGEADGDSGRPARLLGAGRVAGLAGATAFNRARGWRHVTDLCAAVTLPTAGAEVARQLALGPIAAERRFDALLSSHIRVPSTLPAGRGTDEGWFGADGDWFDSFWLGIRSLTLLAWGLRAACPGGWEVRCCASRSWGRLRLVSAETLARAPAGHNGLLAGVPLVELERLRPHLTMISLEPKRFFLPAEQPLSHVYFPYAGMTSLMVGVRAGQTVQVAAVGREGMLGVSVVLEANDPPYAMVCQVRGEALRMPVGRFATFAHELPAFRRLLLRYALGLLHEAARTAACNGLHSVEQRLARWLLLSRDRVAADSFSMTHESLAHMLGVGRPFVTQTLAGFGQAGLIQHRRGVLRIIDRTGLEAVACEDYQVVRDEYARLLTK